MILVYKILGGKIFIVNRFILWMEHIAIMKKSLGYLEKIISGDKLIESRWYNSKISPWGKALKGDVIYFKNSGCEINVRARIDNVLEFSNLTSDKIWDILSKFGNRIGVEDLKDFFEKIKNKRYCILIFLKEVEEIKSFDIDKKGFGIMSAWICIEDVGKIKI